MKATLQTRGKPRADVTLVESVRSHILDEIIAGRYAPGDRLREVEIAAKLGVSRTPIREAVKALEAEGLIVVEPWRGIVIAKLTHQQVAELFQFREILEGLSAFLAASTITDAELDQLDEILEDIDACDRSDVEAMLQKNRIYHQKTCEASRNRFLVQTLESLRTSLALLPKSAYAADGRDKEIRKEHRKIYDALRRRDPESARAAARDHVRKSGLAQLANIMYNG